MLRSLRLSSWWLCIRSLYTSVAWMLSNEHFDPGLVSADAIATSFKRLMLQIVASELEAVSLTMNGHRPVWSTIKNDWADNLFYLSVGPQEIRLARCKRWTGVDQLAGHWLQLGSADSRLTLTTEVAYPWGRRPCHEITTHVNEGISTNNDQHCHHGNYLCHHHQLLNFLTLEEGDLAKEQAVNQGTSSDGW